MVHDLFLIIAGWAIPLIGVKMLSAIPVFRNWLDGHLLAKSIATSWLISVLVSGTALMIYDKYFLRFSNGDLQTQIEQIQKTLFDASSDLVPSDGNRYIPGTYAVNVDSHSVPGGDHGYVESVAVACKALHFDRPK